MINNGDSQTSPLPIFPEGEGRSVQRLALLELLFNDMCSFFNN